MPRSLLMRTAVATAALTCALGATAQACTHGAPPTGAQSDAPAVHHVYWPGHGHGHGPCGDHGAPAGGGTSGDGTTTSTGASGGT